MCYRCLSRSGPAAKSIVNHVAAHGITPLPVRRAWSEPGVQLMICALCLGEQLDPSTGDPCPRCMATGLESESDSPAGHQEVPR